MNENNAIRFINSSYDEIFRIPDGEKIKIIYSDGREPVEKKCKNIDSYHLYVGNNVYHICEFAEMLEKIGAKCEPVLTDELCEKLSQSDDYRMRCTLARYGSDEQCAELFATTQHPKVQKALSERNNTDDILDLTEENTLSR